MLPEPGGPRDGPLADALTTLGNPTRLAILRQLREPRALREIEARVPGDPAKGDLPLRTISRQAVRHHLDALVELGVVVAREAERPYGPTVEYVMNHQRVFMLAEEFRGLARLRPRPELHVPTAAQSLPMAPFTIRGPCLVLARGLDEGRTFPLVAAAGQLPRWVVGRSRGVEVPLDFDPFVSTENAVIACEAGAFFVEDLPGSRNGTTLNFHRLPEGERRSLRTGDLVGVGRCLLLFRE